MSELLGEFSRKLDAKGRLSLPADFRKELSDNLRMTLSLDGTCLYIFETEDFNKWVDSLFDARGGFNVGDSNMVRLKLKLNSRASKSTMRVVSTSRLLCVRRLVLIKTWSLLAMAIILRFGTKSVGTSSCLIRILPPCACDWLGRANDDKRISAYSRFAP